MRRLFQQVTALGLFLGLLLFSVASQNEVEIDSSAYTIGKALYTKGVMPNGGLVKATIHGDISVEGDQLICETCHRKSGMGSTEGQQVVPAIAGNLLFKPLQLPTSKPPEPPVYRPAYTKQTLMAAIRDGIDANGKPLDPFMPRYNIDEASLEGLMAYVNTLSQTPSPGVTEETIHFSTIVLSSNSEMENKALLDVMDAYVEQKNIETRHESKRAKNAPWHKEWMFKPYRKWKIHTWELKGEEDTWRAQLDTYYLKQPVFAVINGLVPTGWVSVSEFCEDNSIPCLFPTTQLPVISEQNHYSIYLDRGAVQEAEAAASYIKKDLSHGGVIQIYDSSDQLSIVALDALEKKLKNSGVRVKRFSLDQLSSISLSSIVSDVDGTMVLWLDKAKTDELLNDDAKLPDSLKIVISSQFYGTDTHNIHEDIRDSVLFVHSAEIPSKLNRLLIRSTGWFRAKRIYNKQAQEIQANAYFALKVVGDSVKHIRGYFYRDYLIEKIEHMIDDLPYTSIYPRLSMAPEQRFASRGYYMAKADGKGGIINYTDWMSP
ncbi:MAG: hypothetical protein JAY67_15900 [Candidatus Thiodiazotropha taylori]|nr:hypothetical protein [Candidatus Thiodiazotropha taylori]